LKKPLQGNQGLTAFGIELGLPPESASTEEVGRQIGMSADTLKRWRSQALAHRHATYNDLHRSA